MTAANDASALAAIERLLKALEQPERTDLERTVAVDSGWWWRQEMRRA